MKLSRFGTLPFLILLGAVASHAEDSAQAGTPIVRMISGPTHDPKADAEAKAKAEKEESDALMKALGAVTGMAGSNTSASHPSFSSEVANPNGAFYGDSPSNGIRPTAATDLKGSAKIIPVFNKYYGACTQSTGLGNCKFVNEGIMGDAAHRARASCHNSGEAIDIGPLTCSPGGTIGTKDPRFFKMAQCMANQTNNELQVIYYQAAGPNMILKSDHTDHMHIQLKNCAMVYGR